MLKTSKFPQVCMYSICLKFICSDCDAKDSEGKRPLHLAAYGKGSHARDVVDVLIEKGETEIGKLSVGDIGLLCVHRAFCMICTTIGSYSNLSTKEHS